MFFSEVIANEAVKQKLVHTVNANRVYHAQLFLGPEGNGSLPLAIAYAQFLLCENRRENDSCGQCNACNKVSKLLHPDVHFSFPVVKEKGTTRPPLSSDYIEPFRRTMLARRYFGLDEWYDAINAENKQGNITADECYHIVKQLHLKPYEAPRKIFIIWMPEYLGKEGNILLKSLEEPNGDTVFLLVGESEESILPTIVSRCQLVNVPRLSEEELALVLSKQHDLEPVEAAKLARFAQGNYIQAIRELNDSTDVSEKLLQRWLRASLDGDMQALNLWIEDVCKPGREKQKAFLRYVMDFLHNALVAKTAGADAANVRAEEQKLVQWGANQLTMDGIEYWYTLLEKAHHNIERNANPRIQLMADSLALHELLRNNRLILSRA
jgi:DNA polymerase III subunit delta'